MFSDLVGKAGKLPAESLSAKVVKCHYQAEGAPFGWRAVSEKQVLVPELLLNDDELVVTDHDRRRNLVKCTPASSDAYYVDINTTWRKGFGASFPAADLPIRDAKTLQPFGLRADENKQLVVRIPVPKGISAGRYEGTVRIVEGSHDVANVGVSLEVLPFGLPKAETSYDPTREYTMGLYLWGSLSEDGGANLSLFRKSREQLLNEYRIMREYRIDNPLFVWRAWEVFKDDVFRRHLDVAREAGYSGTLHIGANSFRLPMDGKAIATLKTDVARAIRTAAEYGFDEVYFYGIDEARGDVLIQERPVWQAIREAGGKVCVSGYKKHFEAVGDILDMCIYAEEPGSADPAPWHRIGHRLWKYNTPQAGAEDPNVFRKAYGLRLWARGFDGASTYCNCDTPFWNDIYMQVRCKALKEPVTGTVLRALNFFYATVDGAVETIQLSGLEAAIKDVQYLTKLRQLQRERKDAETARYLDSLNFEGADPATVRREVIDRICRFYAKP